MIKKITNEGELMPSFYYGLAYRKWDSYQGVWYPIPINYIVRSFYWLNWKWNGFRASHGRSSWIDDKILDALRKNDLEWSEKLKIAWEEATFYRKLYDLIIDERKETKQCF